MRIVFTLVAVTLLAGCSQMSSLVGLGGPCRPCVAEHDQAFATSDADGMLVYGLTIRHSGTTGEIGGAVDWMVEIPGSNFPSLVSISFPEGMKANQRQLVVWRVPAGTWSVRQVRWEQDDVHGSTPPAAGMAQASIVAKGEVTYVGDIVIDFDRVPASVMVTDGRESAAVTLKNEFSRVTAPMLVHPLKDLRVAPEGKRHRGINSYD